MSLDTEALEYAICALERLWVQIWSCRFYVCNWIWL